VARSAEEDRRDLASERAELTSAVGELREEGGRLKAKLPLLAGGALASVVALKALGRAFRRR
jgi:hypothetical protein